MNKTYDFSGTCLSVDPPPYAFPPYQYRDNQMLTLRLEVAEDYLRALVPEPMIVNEDNTLVVYIGWLHVIEPKVVSYGEERAASFGSNAAAWSMNRRVELK